MTGITARLMAPIVAMTAANTAPAVAVTVNRGDPPSPRRIRRQTDPNHQNKATTASPPVVAAHRILLPLSPMKSAILLAESPVFGGYPGRIAVIATSTTNRIPPSAPQRSQLRSSSMIPPMNRAAQ